MWPNGNWQVDPSANQGWQAPYPATNDVQQPVQQMWVPPPVQDQIEVKFNV